MYFNAEPLFTGKLIFGFKQETGELTFDLIQETNTTYRVLDHQERWSMKLYVLDSIRVRCEPKFLNVNSHGSYLASLYLQEFDFGIGWLIYLSKGFSQHKLTTLIVSFKHFTGCTPKFSFHEFHKCTSSMASSNKSAFQLLRMKIGLEGMVN